MYRIGSLAIKTSYQWKGLAKELMQTVIDDLVTDGIKRTQLIVESDNPRAIKFYEGLGFEIEGTLRKFYKRKDEDEDEDEYIDDYMMSLIV